MRAARARVIVGVLALALVAAVVVAALLLLVLPAAEHQDEDADALEDVGGYWWRDVQPERDDPWLMITIVSAEGEPVHRGSS